MSQGQREEPGVTRLGPTFPLARQGPLLVAGALEGVEGEEEEESRDGKEVVKW